MKRFCLIIGIVALVAVAQVAAQTKAENPYLAAAIDLRAQAMTAYNQGDYDGAADLVAKAKAQLKLSDALLASQKGKVTLPAAYKVRLIPADRDSLSKIAGYSFVYGDRRKWTVLYWANKDKMPDQKNADLIYPDMLLAIPSIAGEERGGEWSPDISYPKFTAK